MKISIPKGFVLLWVLVCGRHQRAKTRALLLLGKCRINALILYVNMLRYSCWQGYFLVSKGAKRYTSTLRNISNLHPKRTYCNSKMVVFDRNIKKKHRDRASLSKNYDYLREEVAKRLVERLDVLILYTYC